MWSTCSPLFVHVYVHVAAVGQLACVHVVHVYVQATCMCTCGTCVCTRMLCMMHGINFLFQNELQHVQVQLGVAGSECTVTCVY